MSETHYVRCTRVGSNEVCRSSDGWAEIEPMHQGRSMGERITIMREDVPAVALALLGLTDALVERAAKALHDPAAVGAAWDGCAICERDARRVVQAIFGVEDDEPGSGQ